MEAKEGHVVICGAVLLMTVTTRGERCGIREDTGTEILETEGGCAGFSGPWVMIRPSGKAEVSPRGWVVGRNGCQLSLWPGRQGGL